MERKYPIPDHEPQNFIVRTYYALNEEIERRHPDESALHKIKEEKLLNAELFVLGGPFVMAFLIEKLAVELLQTANDILTAGAEGMIDFQNQVQERLRKTETKVDNP